MGRGLQLSPGADEPLFVDVVHDLIEPMNVGLNHRLCIETAIQDRFVGGVGHVLKPVSITGNGLDFVDKSIDITDGEKKSIYSIRHNLGDAAFDPSRNGNASFGHSLDQGKGKALKVGSQEE